MNEFRVFFRFSVWKKARLPLIVFLLLTLGAAGFYYWTNWENPNHEKPDWGGRAKPMFYRNTLLEGSAAGTAEGLKIPLSVYRDAVDSHIRYEEQGESLILTTQDKVVRVRVGDRAALVNEKPATLSQTAEKAGKDILVPLETFQGFNPAKTVQVSESKQTGAVLLSKEGDEIAWGKVKAYPKQPQRTAALRSRPSIKSTIYADVAQGERVMIWGGSGEWLQIQLSNGYSGYVKSSEMDKDGTEKIPVAPRKPAFEPWKPAGGKINLTWQQVAPKNPDTSKIPPMPGLNVISPQWFHLADGDGNIKNLADPAFMKWALGRKYQVWALFSNGFEPKRTTEALATYDKRMKMIKQLLGFARTYGFQGINLDFENVSVKDKTNMIQFIREMTPMLHEQGLVVSIDVTVKDGSENYSLFMDRRAAAESVDYMMVMAYDEYWASSPKAGSVSSLPWVEQGISKILTEDGVPPSKMLLGVPYYTRIWTEQTKNGKNGVSSKAVSMEQIQKILKEKKLTPVFQPDTGQNYVEYKEGDAVMKIWIEDAVSMKSRASLVNKYSLGGLASWSRGFESPDIWKTIADTLQ